MGTSQEMGICNVAREQMEKGMKNLERKIKYEREQQRMLQKGFQKKEIIKDRNSKIDFNAVAHRKSTCLIWKYDDLCANQY